MHTLSMWVSSEGFQRQGIVTEQCGSWRNPGGSVWQFSVMAKRGGDKKSDHVLGDSNRRGTRKRLEPRAGYWAPGERCRKRRGTQRHKLPW